MEDLQLCIDFVCKIFWLYSFKTKYEIKKNKISKTYLRYLKSFTNHGYRKVCLRSLRSNLVNITFNIS